jgi:hypothetical protein
VRLFVWTIDESIPAMKVKWIGLFGVVLIASTIIGYKVHVSREMGAASATTPPRVLLVADLSEANAAGDSCADIIHLVRAARDRGIPVQELQAGSNPDLLSRYHVLAIPTVLILDHNGKEVARYQGEGRETVEAVRTGLDQLR